MLHVRALRICYPKHLNDEFNHIENSFLNLLNPKSFIHFALNIEPLKFTIRINLELKPTHPPIKLVFALYIHYVV